MTCRTAKARSGITLTEILISILIMGVGLISLATLFPIGLVRLREAGKPVVASSACAVGGPGLANSLIELVSALCHRLTEAT